MREEDEFIRTTNGNLIQHPALGALNTSLKVMRGYMSEFGLTPASRVRRCVEAGEDEDKLDGFLDDRKKDRAEKRASLKILKKESTTDCTDGTDKKGKKVG